ncbi:hypothetical protein LTR53_019258, partial [Teratosphaeriaceae sp. CCFEE 6253]
DGDEDEMMGDRDEEGTGESDGSGGGTPVIRLDVRGEFPEGGTPILRGPSGAAQGGGGGSSSSSSGVLFGGGLQQQQYLGWQPHHYQGAGGGSGGSGARLSQSAPSPSTMMLGFGPHVWAGAGSAGLAQPFIAPLPLQMQQEGLGRQAGALSQGGHPHQHHPQGPG